MKARRICAFIIDAFLTSCCSFICFFLISSPDAAYIIGSLVALCFSCWQISMEASEKQASLGKQWLGLRVVTEQGQTLTLGQSWGRWLIKGMCYIILPIDCLVFLIDDHGRSLHCRLSKTAIKGARAYQPSPKPSPTPSSKKTSFSLLCTKGQYKTSSFRLNHQATVLGRDSKRCNLVFRSHTKGVSGVHCYVKVQDHEVIVKDLGSTYGTVVFGGKRLRKNESARLHHGDSFSVGSETFVIR